VSTSETHLPTKSSDARTAGAVSRQEKGQGPEMIQELSTGGNLSTTRPRAERRIAVRLPITVRGRDASGVTFEEVTSSENLCRGGAAFRTRFDVSVGSDLDICIPLSQTGARRKHKGDDFAAQGRVVHVRDGESGEFSLSSLTSAVIFLFWHPFFYALSS
jgi:hypothetical protein